MTTIHAATALLAEGWRNNVRLGIEAGRIATLEIEAPARPGDERHAIVLPAMPNLHSHAFQRGMAGLAERRGPGTDSFWSWRELMYRFALKMAPEQLEAVAAQLYAEMLEAGFARVGEFHYLHHDPAGQPYANPAEMGARIAAAAQQSGIGLCLMPVFYAHSGFGGAAPGAAQRRFVTTPERYARLLEATRSALAPLPGARLGVAPHSLRAVTPEELGAVLTLAPTGPVHLHIAEQTQEVEDCRAWSGARPVQWLIDHVAVDGRWCLVHATHMTPEETTRSAASGAVVGLCPITEANLGDGIFDAPAFAAAGGGWGIGSDSNVQIGVADELRMLEYSQRLATRQRNVMAEPGASNGRALFDAALAGGAAALGESAGVVGLGVGAAADLVSLDARAPVLAGRSGDALLDAWIFTGRVPVDCVWAGGRKQVEGGRHCRREAIEARFLGAMAELAA
ncbi:MAG: formimidoylglutamate deiminase [Burkholderiales bacterium]|nr:formimidoylglutamate deiminase [Burkholderiales bacterium]